jgi:hypothetical protein
MLARIYRPAKNAMQSGKAKTKDWLLEFAPEDARAADPLMGWTQTRDMDGQIRLSFETPEEAVAYPKPAKRIVKAYADNFAFNRKQPWTH